MFLSTLWAALRRRPFSFGSTLVLLVVFSSLMGAAAPVAVLLWIGLALLGLEVWFVVEPVALRRLGARKPNQAEWTRLQGAVQTCGCRLLILDQPEPWLFPTLRHVVVSRGMLDFVEDRGVFGLVAQATEQQRLAAVVGVPIVWLGNLELVAAYVISCCAVRLGELVASVMGYSLVLPGLLFPNAFRRYGGLLLGTVLLGLIGATLITDSLPGAGLALLVGWAVVRAVDAVLAWESRRLEAVADEATVAAGLGSHLREALETLGWADELPRARGLLGVLQQPGASVAARLERVERLLAGS
ncbi:MAG: hypothetical protein JOZ81_30170 [Chloroflexi bacterium]|nr:hypothetical protein [Chloroflexota bacterium]